MKIIATAKQGYNTVNLELKDCTLYVVVLFPNGQQMSRKKANIQDPGELIRHWGKHLEDVTTFEKEAQ